MRLPGAFIGAALIVLGFLSRAEGQSAALMVTPAAVDDPALKYRLTPELSEQTPGNAATVYLTATTMAEGPDGKFWDSIEALRDKPTSQWQVDEARKIVADRAAWLEMLDVAAGREKCDWDLPLREMSFRTLLPYLNTLRVLTYILDIRTRLAILEHRWDDAARSLRTTLALCNHLARDGLLIHALVAAGIRNIACDSIREWITTPNSPNLYWALIQLRPMSGTMAGAMRQDRAMVYSAFPVLRSAGIAEASVSTAEWNRIAAEIAKHLALTLPQNQKIDQAQWSVESLLPFAQAYLLAHGTTEQQVGQLHPATIVARYAAGELEEVSQEMDKWCALPYWQGIQNLRSAETTLGETFKTSPNPLLKLIPVTASRSWTSLTRTDRTVAALAAVEAIRAYTAAHKGQSFSTLDQIVDTPVPLDPLTGKSFACQARPGGFILESAGAPSDQSIRYDVTFKP